ncbi:hypothetical protein [Roseobacter weihaiensis]|nr:hypothetical protein [Roseobacter sp. H9]
MSIELFAIGSSGLALVAVILMVATRTDDAPTQDLPRPDPKSAARKSR